MKRKDIDISIISDMLSSIPDDMDVEAIEFSQNNYRLKFVADYKVLMRQYRNKAADELYKQILSLEQGKTYPEIDDTKK